MPLRYKRLLMETNTYSIAKTGKQKNKLDSNYEDSLPNKYELIAQIDTNLKHLQGQQKILQNAKYGKTWRHTFSLNRNTNQTNQKPSMSQCKSRCNVSCAHICYILQKMSGNKTIKVTDSYTQIGSSLNNLNTKRNCKGSPSADLQKCKYKNSNFDQNAPSPSDESSFNYELKISNNRPIRKVNSKTQINVSNKYFKRHLSQKYKEFCLAKSSSESCQIGPRFESKVCETFHVPPETSYDKKNNLPKTVKARSIYAQNFKNSPECTIAIRSPRSHKHTDKTSSPTWPKTGGRNLDRTASSIRKHAKLSKEILDYAKQMSEQTTNKERKRTEIQPGIELWSHEGLMRDSELPKNHRNSKLYKKRENVKQNVSVYNHDTFIIVNPDGRKFHDKKKYRKNDHEISRSKNNNLTETSRSSNINVIKTNVIDDSTYVCPDNSEENDYLILPYVGDISKDKVKVNISPNTDRADNLDSDIKEIASKSIVVLEDISSQPSSKQSPSTGNGRKARSYLNRNGFSKNRVNQKIKQEKELSQRSDKSEYMSHNFENTWESHANSERPFSSKFYTSHKNSTDFRSHYYNLKDKSFSKQSLQRKNDMKPLSSVDTEYISKPLQSNQLDLKELFHDQNPIKLASQKEQEKWKVMPLADLSKNNQFRTCSQLEKQTDRASFTSESKIHSPETSEKYEELQEDSRQDTILEKDNFEIVINSKESGSINNEIQEEVFEQRRQMTKLHSFENGALLEKDTNQDQPRLRSAKNDFQHKCSFLAKEKQLNLNVSQVSQRNEMAPKPIRCELGAISRVNLIGRNLFHPLLPASTKDNDTQDIVQKTHNRGESKMKASTGGICLKFEGESTLQKKESPDNQSDMRKSNSICKLTSKVKQTGFLKSESFPSIVKDLKLNPVEKLSAGETILDDSLKLQNIVSKSSILLPVHTPSKSSISLLIKKPVTAKPKIHISPAAMSLQYEPEQPLKENTPKGIHSDEKTTGRSKNIDDIVSKTFPSKLDAPELGAISKLNVNARPRMFKTRDLSNKSSHSYPEVHNSNIKVSTELETTSSQKEELEVHESGAGTSERNNISDAEVSTSSRLNPYKMSEHNRYSISNDIKELESPTICNEIFSQQSNKSSGSQYLKLFWNNSNNKKEVKNIFQTSKLWQKSNFSRSSKSSQYLNNQDSAKILQATSSTIFSSDKLEASDISSRSKLGFIPTNSLRTEITNKQSIEQNVEEIRKSNISKRMETKIPDSKMSLSFPRPEEWLTVKELNNQTINKLNENFSEHSSLSRDDNMLNETNGNVKSQKHVFLSDTFNQNISVEGVPPEVSDLIQHLHNRVMDCDENVKNQYKELERLKENCKTVEPSTSTFIDEYGKKSQEKKQKDLLENIGTNELIEPLIREESSENDLKEENSCLYLICGQEKSTSNNSEEIPLFIGCECMKEDYYKIMRIAYNK